MFLSFCQVYRREKQLTMITITCDRCNILELSDKINNVVSYMKTL